MVMLYEMCHMYTCIQGGEYNVCMSTRTPLSPTHAMLKVAFKTFQLHTSRCARFTFPSQYPTLRVGGDGVI